MKFKKLIGTFFSVLTVFTVSGFCNTFACDNDGYSKTSEYIQNDVVYMLNESDHTALVCEVKNVNLAEVVIPESVNDYKVTGIAERAFGKPVYKKWNRVVLPDSIVKIGNKSFNFCPELKFVKLPNNLESIGNEAFRLCANLETLTIPDKVVSIGEEAFFGCVSLKNINIPTNLTELEKGLFKHCVSLKGINIHKNVNKISPDIFDECGINLELKNTNIGDDNKEYKRQGNSIVSKKTGDKILTFPTLDNKYIVKKYLATKLQLAMKNFIKNNASDCSVEDFDKLCKDFLERNSSKPKLLSLKEFQKDVKNKMTLYRGISSKEYVNDFKSGKMFFSDNLSMERGNGIYTTSQYDHASIWIWSTNPNDWKAMEPYENDETLYNEMLYKLVPHGEVIKMFLNDSAKILNNSDLREIKDLVFKMEPEKFKNVLAWNDCNFPKACIKDLSIFNTKEQLLFHNSGLLTKLLGYDVLYEKETNMVLDEEKGILGDEYLIVNPGVLNVLDNSNVSALHL